MSELLASVFADDEGSQKHEALMQVVEPVDIEELAQLTERVMAQLAAQKEATVL